MSKKLETQPTSRRSFFAGATAVGVAAAAVTTLPKVTAPTTAANALPPAPDNGGGYNLSEHVKRYYKTARV